jgi:hypothetical protein
MNTPVINSIPFSIKGKWAQDGVIPPRCRNPRTVVHDIETTIHIRSITSEEMPVAIRRRNTNGTSTDLYFFEGHYYVPFSHYSTEKEQVTAGSPQFPFEQEKAGYYYSDQYKGKNLDEALANIQRSYDRYLIVDGIVWERGGSEPYYEAYRSGGGFYNTNGRTYISATTHTNQGEWSLFNALEWDEALAYALSITPEGEREQTRERLEAESRTIEVLNPEVITNQFKRTHAEGIKTISRYTDQARADFKQAMESSESIVDPEAVGRGEISYREFLEASLKHLLEVEEPRLRAYEAERKAQFGY